MPVTRAREFVASLSILTLMLAGPSHAAGPWITETGGADMGLAGAGRAALALDAASLSANPAAIGALPASEVTLSAISIDLDYAYRGATGGTDHARNHEGPTLLPAVYGVHRGDRLALGVGAYSYFGLSIDSGGSWGGQRAVEHVGIATFNVAPAAAWSVNDRITLGIAVDAQWAKPEMRVAVASDAAYYGPPAGLPDGRLALSGDSWGIGGQLGLRYASRDGTRVGLAWTAPVRHSASLDVAGTGIHPALATVLPADGVAKFGFTIPQQVSFGVSRPIGSDTQWAVGLSWQDWSTLGQAKVTMPGYSAPVLPGGLQDTWSAAAGLRRAVGAQWTASAGVDYESSPATGRGVPAYFPVAEQWRVAAGVERSFGDELRLRGSVSVILQGDSDVVQAQHPLPLPGIPRFTGTYEETRVYVLALSADFRP